MKTMSFQRKVFWGFVMVALVSLCLVVIPVLWNINQQFQVQMEAYSRSQSKVLADMSAAAMMFEQSESASVLLKSLQQSPDILRAALYKSDGAQQYLFASYGSDAPPQINPNTQSSTLGPGFYRLITPVVLDNNVIGYLLLDSSLLPMEHKLLQSYGFVLIAVIVAIVLASWLALRLSRSLLQPLADLRSVTGSIADTKSYSRRALPSTDPDLEIFIRSFNSMLDVIQRIDQAQQDKELEILDLNKTLEQKVVVRTAELESSLNDLKSTQRALVERERLASLGSLVAGVAHEINTPVGVAMTAVTHLTYLTQHLSDELNAGTLSKSSLLKHIQELNESALIVQKNIERAADQIRSFKMVAIDQSTEEAREFKLLAYLQDIVLSLRPQLKKGDFQVILKVDPDLTLHSFPGIYSQIFTNLIMNSLIHGFSGQSEGEITIAASFQQNYLQLNYYDNGKGIEPKIKARLWDPFVTTNRQQGGSGLGTYILYNLITQGLNGRIDLVEDVSKGVHFVILIPLSDSKLGFYPRDDQT